MRTVTLNSTTIPAVHSCVPALYRWSYIHGARPRILRRKSSERMKSEQTDSLWLVRVQAHVRSSPREWVETLMSWMSDCTLILYTFDTEAARDVSMSWVSDCTLNSRKMKYIAPFLFLCPECRTVLWTSSSQMTQMRQFLCPEYRTALWTTTTREEYT